MIPYPRMQFITQPFSEFRLGEYILGHLADSQWTIFRAAVAFVRRSGTLHIRGPLRSFSDRAQVRLSVGVDLRGTSMEGLSDVLDATTPNGRVFIYHNNGSSTFHPKIYLFKSSRCADLVVGSGNMTSGGLFTNYEASLVVSLDLALQTDTEFLRVVERTLDEWSEPRQGLCYGLTSELLDQLVAWGLVPTEAQIAATQRQVRNLVREPGVEPAAVSPHRAPASAQLFVTTVVPPAPHIAPSESEAPEREAEDEATELSTDREILLFDAVQPMRDGSRFVMTLQNTDVGVGQTTPGTSRRSPEVFIPLAALDENPAFWSFPDAFEADLEWNEEHPERRNGLGKMDRMDVPMRIGVVQSVRMFFNPRKGDFRLGNEVLRSAGRAGDILLVKKVDLVNGFEYDIQVAPQGSPLFERLLLFCNTRVQNSLKRFGYF